MISSFAEKHLQQARASLNQCDYAHALQMYEKLVRQQPHRTILWLEYGAAAAGNGQIDLAEQLWSKAESLDPRNPSLSLQIGHQWRGFRQLDKAKSWFEKAAVAGPKDINPRMALAILAEQNNDFKAAREAIDACFAIDSRDEQARYYASLLERRENKLVEAERQLRDLIASHPQHQYVQYAARYDLADVLDRTGRFDEAMQELIQAKSLVARLGKIPEMIREYDEEAGQYRRSTAALPKDTLRTWNKSFPEKTRTPIPHLAFLGGHPRSGTTLLEQILGAHPQVAALDEPTHFTMEVCQLFNGPIPATSPRLNLMRRRYIDAMQKEWGETLDGKMLLDKNPSPTLKLRIWLKVFPELRVLIALRDPRDVVISCYFQNLVLNSYNVNFLTLERTARHYADLMDVWLAVRQWEGLDWTETRYEDLVADMGKEGQRVTNFLGLEWDNHQEKFYEKRTGNKMHSPTYHDARQPIYKRAVARWRAYEKQLTPILPILEPYCKAFGYS